MPKRAFLTSEFIKALEPPSCGELWIADTKIKGFGLRVRIGTDGTPVKSFCVRYVDENQRQRRKTFKSPTNPYQFWVRYQKRPTESDLLDAEMEAAREWALACQHDRRDFLRNTPTYNVDKIWQAEIIRNRYKDISLGRAIELLLAGMKSRGKPDPQIDRLRTVFYKYVSEISELPISKISTSELSKVFCNSNLSDQNLQILRPFLGSVFLHKMVPRSTRLIFREARLIAKKNRQTRVTSTISNWEFADYREFFSIILGHEEYFSQALCILLYLDSTRSPLTSAMAARWGDFSLVAPSKNVHLCGLLGRTKEFLRWKFGPRRWDFENLDDFTSEALIEYRTGISQKPEPNEYIFKSSPGKDNLHIRTVDYVWRSSLRKIGLSYLTPRQFRLGYLQNLGTRFS